VLDGYLVMQSERRKTEFVMDATERKRSIFSSLPWRILGPLCCRMGTFVPYSDCGWMKSHDASSGAYMNEGHDLFSL
jgi:hypothetical protein